MLKDAREQMANLAMASMYVGETGHTSKSRVDEHFFTALRCSGQCKSSIMQLARENDHHFRKTDYEVVANDDDWFRRGVKEGAYIQALNPSINEHPGRHTLPPNYDDILPKAIKRLSPVMAHDASIEDGLDTAPK